jgi:hypothetical protein
MCAADQGLSFGIALVASAVMSPAFFCGEEDPLEASSTMRTCSPRSSESQFGAKEIEIRLSHAVAMGGQDRTLSLP